MQPIPEMNADLLQRLERVEKLLRNSIERQRLIEKENDLLMNFAKTAAQTAGLYARSKQEFSVLENKWDSVQDERKLLDDELDEAG